MSCDPKDTNIPITIGKEEYLPITLYIDNIEVNLNWKTIHLLIWEKSCTNWNEWWTWIIIFRTISPTVLTTTALFILSSQDTLLLEEKTYKYRIKVLETWQEPIRYPLYDLTATI